MADLLYWWVLGTLWVIRLCFTLVYYVVLIIITAVIAIVHGVQALIVIIKERRHAKGTNAEG